ncbi:MAG TPA: lytic transglycosylase domain-containing protein [Acetobacteraceae bacterium]|nr:lytic transglycosylase domain-containing protein [Acetobacteraceae bacterium]
MRGIGRTLSRLPGARVLVAGAAILATAVLGAAKAQESGVADQTAMAIPRIEAPGAKSGVALPQPLTPSDAARIRRIFADQAHGRSADAVRETADLESKLLLGSILADRYLGRFHRSTTDELAKWLTDYPDQPDAPAIHALLVRRLPAKAKAPDLTPLACLAPVDPSDTTDSADTAADPSLPHNPALEREVAGRVRADRFSTALHLIAHTKGLQGTVAAMLRAQVARGLFAADRDNEALQAAAAAMRSAKQPDRAGFGVFIGGLAAWRLGRFEESRKYFQQTAEAGMAPAHVRAAGAFWAARAALRLHDQDGSTSWLERAAAEKFTFYGMLARRKLNWPIGLIPTRGTLALADIDALAALPRGLRAFALLQVGERVRAEQEFRCLWPSVRNDPALRRALLLVVSHAGLTGLAAQIGGLIEAADGIPHDDLGFPVPSLHPAGGFRFDPALVYGMTRAESNFDANAVSPAGARGLMQIMPVTARAITGNARLPADRLAEPGFNLELGQRWVMSLAGEDLIDGSLIAMLASYNAGLGGFASWKDDVHADGDPLLFIEAIPVPETRRFVQRALTYTWIYAARLGLAAPSLDEMAGGEFPRFTSAPQDGKVLVSLH